MNDRRITDYVDGLFAGLKETDALRDQKEELRSNITERVKDLIANDGATFDDAFNTATKDLGDVGELRAAFDSAGEDEKKPRNFFAEHRVHHPQFIPLAPLIYVALGFAFGWWAWAWVIIPCMPILLSNTPPGQKFVACSPFIYVLLGMFFGWWAWGWIIIPASAILLGGRKIIK